jgi:hypothetical protein
MGEQKLIHRELSPLIHLDGLNHQAYAIGISQMSRGVTKGFTKDSNNYFFPRIIMLNNKRKEINLKKWTKFGR